MAVATLFTFLDGLALARLVPSCQLVPDDQLLDVFKLLISGALPAPAAPATSEGETP